MSQSIPEQKPQSLDEISRDILRARARALARVEESRDNIHDTLQIVEFQLAGERYGIETGFVREVHPLKELTTLPGTPAFLLGIVNVRSSILPVIDLKKFFGLPGEGITDLNKIIIVQDPEIHLGILADMIWGVSEIERAGLQTELAALDGVRADYFQGVTEERLIILDMQAILHDRRILVDDMP